LGRGTKGPAEHHHSGRRAQNRQRRDRHGAADHTQTAGRSGLGRRDTLTGQKPSLDDYRLWIVVDEGNEFLWPGYDLRKPLQTSRRCVTPLAGHAATERTASRHPKGWVTK
jgi:hypothetical protein